MVKNRYERMQELKNNITANMPKFFDILVEIDDERIENIFYKKETMTKYFYQNYKSKKYNENMIKNIYEEIIDMAIAQKVDGLMHYLETTNFVMYMFLEKIIVDWEEDEFLEKLIETIDNLEHDIILEHFDAYAPRIEEQKIKLIEKFIATLEINEKISEFYEYTKNKQMMGPLFEYYTTFDYVGIREQISIYLAIQLTISEKQDLVQKIEKNMKSYICQKEQNIQEIVDDIVKINEDVYLELF